MKLVKEITKRNDKTCGGITKVKGITKKKRNLMKGITKEKQEKHFFL